MIIFRNRLNDSYISVAKKCFKNCKYCSLMIINERFFLATHQIQRDIHDKQVGSDLSHFVRGSEECSNFGVIFSVKLEYIFFSKTEREMVVLYTPSHPSYRSA